MLRTLIETGSNNAGRSGPLAKDGPLVYEVIDNFATLSFLGPALLHSYEAVGKVEGQDVDVEDFDQYAVKHDLSCLLKRIWVAPAHRLVICSQASLSVMGDFGRSLMKNLLFVSGGCFDSLREVLLSLSILPSPLVSIF